MTKQHVWIEMCAARIVRPLGCCAAYDERISVSAEGARPSPPRGELLRLLDNSQAEPHTQGDSQTFCVLASPQTAWDVKDGSTSAGEFACPPYMAPASMSEHAVCGLGGASHSLA